MKIPTLNEAIRKYEAAKAEGKTSEALTELEQFVLYFTPESVFRVNEFRRMLAAIIKETKNSD